jgi:hypothetical protein
MDEDTFNQHLRKFLKKVGINAQREIERAVREGIDKGQLNSEQPIKATMTLDIPELDVNLKIEDHIALE